MDYRGARCRVPRHGRQDRRTDSGAGKLWLPIGIHLGWDFAIFATGPEALLTLSEISVEAPPALATVIMSIPNLVLATVLLALVVRQGLIRTPRWMQCEPRTHNKPYICENIRK